MKKANSSFGVIIHFLAHPTGWVISKIKVIKKSHSKGFNIVFGVVVLLTGAYCAHIKQTYIPDFAWDGLTYGVHGMGVAPIIKIVFDWLNIEI